MSELLGPEIEEAIRADRANQQQPDMSELVIVESRLLDNDWTKAKETAKWCGGTWLGSGGNGFAIQLPEKLIFASQGDFIAKDSDGNFWLCKDFFNPLDDSVLP